jgi:hypothetical protein
MTKDEEMALREYAAGRACTQSVIDALGPMSLWSKSAFDAEIRKAVEAEREACAKVCENLVLAHPGRADMTADQCATAIRARGQA